MIIRTFKFYIPRACGQKGDFEFYIGRFAKSQIAILILVEDPQKSTPFSFMSLVVSSILTESASAQPHQAFKFNCTYVQGFQIWT